MKIFSKVLALMALVAVTVACEKEKKEETQPSAVSSCDYFTYKVGNQMVLRKARTGVDTVSVTGTTTIDGKEWLVFSDDSSSTYARCDGQFFLNLFVYNGQTIIRRLMKTSPSVDDTWTDTEIINDVESHYKRTVVSVGVTHTVEGTTYDDVAVILMETSFMYGGFEVPQEPYNEYYSKSVGYLESTLENAEETLVSRTY